MLDAFEEFFGVLPHDAADGILGRSRMLTDFLFDFRPQAVVFDHLGVDGEDRTIMGTEFATDFRLFLARFASGGLQRFVEPLQFFVHPAFINDTTWNAEGFGVQHQGRANGHSRRNWNATFDFHASYMTIDLPLCTKSEAELCDARRNQPFFGRRRFGGAVVERFGRQNRRQFFNCRLGLGSGHFEC
ncbi:MAG: hypothetical protein KatS3mg105_1412 [Gemmatales bacterium]|nr:MAG: hypothetical protein KatS3mg105_1412 [Gemmatales bacterium]